MDKYDKKISLATLDSSTISQINAIKAKNPQQKILVEIPNTKGISSELLKKLNRDIFIRIAGAYDKERVSRLGNVKYSNGETGEYYTSAVIYSRNEALKIISEMESIEKGIEGQNADELEKLVYIYGKLKAGIIYDPKFENKSSRDIRSLRGLLTKQTVCAGYSVILKELLDRQGIKCHYVSGKGGSGRRTCLEYCND